ncbi:hypothetical protein LXL04_024250 [Taraxacum kok-saghyz]
MPFFDGTDPDGWILQAERYFAIYQLINEEQIEAAILSLNGEAVSWYRWSNKQQPITTWGQMKSIFLQKFRLIHGGSLYEQWASLEQTGSTGDYIKKFVELAAPLEGVSGPVALANFIKGLRPQIKNELRMWDPEQLGSAMDLAQQIEEKNRALRIRGQGTSGFSPNSTTNFTRSTTNQRRTREDRSLTESQITDKRNRGLCYKCDEKWHKGHRCRTQINVILVDEEDEEEESPDLEENESPANPDTPEVANLVEVSLNSVAGLTAPKTMKLTGQIGDKQVVTRIDPGATHNFITSTLVSSLNLLVTDTEPYGVRMGTSDQETSRGICKGLLLQLPELEVVEDFLPLRLGSADVILGGTRAGKIIDLFETPRVGDEGRTPRHMGALCNTEVDTVATQVPEFLQPTLEHYSILFENPKWLPPRRSIEHQIVLKAGTPPISVRPYRYPHIQKDEIERMIKDMLNTGIIQSSTSLYSSPVILLKKKDGSWRFCVDYRALNRATVPDKFPIPVIDKLLEHRLYLNYKKCDFGQPKLSYLGHEISDKGVAAETSKISAMVDWPTPKNLKGLRGFLELTGYYRKFVRGYADIAKPLTEKLRKDQFGWNDRAEESFKRLKQAMTTVPILAMPDFNKNFEVETDASGYGLGAVLSQEKRPIAFYSFTLGPRAMMKSVYEKELMAIVHAVLKWRSYLMGRKFIVRTDQQSLKYLFEQRLIGSEYQKWISKLVGFDFEIQYRSGASNRVADALSRKEPIKGCNIMELGVWEHRDQLKKEMAEDELLRKLRRDLTADPQSHKDFTLFQDNVLFKGRLMIPASSAVKNSIIHEFHNSPIGGHAGEKKTMYRAALEVYWTGLRQDIVDYIRKCPVCQQQKSLTTFPSGLLQSIPIPTKIWEEVTMDFIEGLPRSNGWDTIWVVVDRLTKYAHFILLRHPFTATTLANTFLKEIVRLHVMPKSIISDRDRIFTGNTWQELFKLYGVHLKRSTAYHPQTDGQSEVVNRCLETYLRCFSSEKPKQWARWLVWAEYWYNTSFHTATKQTLFKALYGCDPPPILRYEG